jgi:K+-sensing histidine kinase KdpD
MSGFLTIRGEISRELMTRVIEELLLNALKYSPRLSAIVVMPRISESECIISILSDPAPDDDGRLGIPIEYENLVFEPFIRLNKKIQSRYQTLDYGLGLMLVENIVQRHGGSVEVGNVKDYTNLSKGEEVRVMSTVRLPVLYIF